VRSDLQGRIAAAPQLAAGRLAELTARFVAVPSVNGEDGERALALEIAAELKTVGIDSVFVGSESRPSVAATTGADPRVLLNGHLDTVPVIDAEEWRYEPFAGVIEDGFVHGRGACDMKGGLAVQVAVAQWLVVEELGVDVVLHFAMGEERGEPGTESLIEAGFTAPLGIVLEPTDLRVGIAQRGLVTLRVVVEGRAGHASRPDLAVNPIDRLPVVLSVVDRLGTEPVLSHDLLGAPTWTPTVVHAGVIPSMVPGRLEVLVDRRMVPGETVQSVLDLMRSALAEVLDEKDFAVSVAEEEGVYAPAEISHDSGAVEIMSRSLVSSGLQSDLFGTPYSSDVRHLINTAGIEALTFGPGRISEAHARDEKVRMSDLEKAARVTAAFVALSGEE
jgi:succinyl-diaminopimelate desuccinylase